MCSAPGQPPDDQRRINNRYGLLHDRPAVASARDPANSLSKAKSFQCLPFETASRCRLDLGVLIKPLVQQLRAFDGRRDRIGGTPQQILLFGLRVSCQCIHTSPDPYVADQVKQAASWLTSDMRTRQHDHFSVDTTPQWVVCEITQLRGMASPAATPG